MEISYRVPDSYSSNLTSQHYPQYSDIRNHGPADVTSAMQNGYTQVPHNNNNIQHTASNNATSPTDDANRPSLPSISNLLGIADGDRTSQPSGEMRNSPQKTQQQTAIPVEHYQNAYMPGTEMPTNPRMLMPPTPPTRSDSIPEAVHSPSTISSAHSSISGPSYQIGSALNNVDAAQQKVYVPMAKPHTVPQHPMYNTSPYGMVPYMTSPSTGSSGSYYSPESMYQTNMYNQRPLPSNFPPTVMAAPMLPPGMIPTTNPWEHHHYIAQTQAVFASVQDRYVCTTCKKAFSRPSSLKIHSHSHTGEKPFKCPHANCGKAFSVRSNMKRHERGCHAEDGGS